MNAIPTWSVRNRVAVNIFTLALLVAGIVGGLSLTRSIFPDISTNFIRITTLDPTTSIPEDIERLISVPIEEELAEVAGLKRVTSYSQDNVSFIFLELESDITDVDPVLNEVRQAVDKAQPKLPASTEPPVVEKFDIPLPLITLTVTHPPDFDLRKVRADLDRIERRLKIIPGVSEVLVDGLSDREVWIELDPYRMQGTGVSFAEVADAVAAKNVNVVGGRIEGAGGERVVRVLGEVKKAAELETLPVKESGGRLVLLRDIANVKETSEKERTRGRFNMEPSITYTIVKKKGADAIDVAARVRKTFATETKSLPESFDSAVTGDTTKYINVRIETVLKNGLQALILVTLLLLLFLNWRLALVVAFGLPVSFAGTFFVLYMCGYTINMLSLFAMIMALGMVVDDAIVISENCFRYIEQGFSMSQAAIRGTGEVLWPVIGSVSTTVAAFLPLMLAEGIIGKFLVIVPIVVCTTLAFSLAQAFFVLPSHIVDFVRRGQSVEHLEGQLAASQSWVGRGALHFGIVYREMRNAVNRALDVVIEIYLHLLAICLRRRGWVLLGFVLSLVAVGIALRLGVVRFQLFATDFADRLIVKLDLPADATLDQTEAAVARVEEKIAATLPQDDLLALSTRIGARLDPTGQFLVYGTNVAMIIVDIDEENPAARKASVIERDVRNLLLGFPQFTEATAEAERGGPPVGRAVNVEIQGPDFIELRKIADEVKARLREEKGVTDLADDLERGKTEFQVHVDEARAARAQLDVRAVGRALQGAFQGIEAARLRWGNDEVTIRVKMQERFAGDPAMLRSFRIQNREGKLVDLSSVATVERTSGLARIKRQGQERMVTVSSDIDDRATTSAEVNAKLTKWIPEIEKAHPGYRLALTGENEDTTESVSSMLFAALIAMLLIYTLLATISNSFFQPFVIMSVIPFGIVGVVLGLIFMEEPLGLMSIMGTIALAGIVVNNSVVFVDFINEYRKDESRRDPETGEALMKSSPLVRWRSILVSGKMRFRPIFLTTSTTVAGLMGLAFTTSGQEQFLAPMAQAVVFGLTFASGLTMILIPCLYSILDDLRLAIKGGA